MQVVVKKLEPDNTIAILMRAESEEVLRLPGSACVHTALFSVVLGVGAFHNLRPVGPAVLFWTPNCRVSGRRFLVQRETADRIERVVVRIGDLLDGRVALGGGRGSAARHDRIGLCATCVRYRRRVQPKNTDSPHPVRRGPVPMLHVRRAQVAIVQVHRPDPFP